MRRQSRTAYTLHAKGRVHLHTECCALQTHTRKEHSSKYWESTKGRNWTRGAARAVVGPICRAVPSRAQSSCTRQGKGGVSSHAHGAGPTTPPATRTQTRTHKYQNMKQFQHRDVVNHSKAN